MEEAHHKLKPDEKFNGTAVQEIYKLYPLPHGTQRAALHKCLSDWGWPAKVLQTVGGGAEGAIWEVGAQKPPPSWVMQSPTGDIVITHLRSATKDPKLTQGASAASTQGDPWHQGPDPWTKSASALQTGQDPAAADRLQQIEHTLQANLQDTIRKELHQLPQQMDGQDDDFKEQTNARFARLVAQWDQINKRYSSHAAPGPDGFDHLDLLRMPVPYREGTVSLLNAIDGGADWPSQLLQGFGICVSQAQTVAEFRPIIILSQIYRSWGALRSRAILRHLSQHAPDGVKGFLPQREAGDVWHYVQMQVELGLQQQHPLSGVISDVKKAFESVPRDPLIQVCLHLGLPPNVLKPWKRFLDSFQRRFLLHNQVGDVITSNHGLPEGDGLSVVGMTIIDLCWDFYQGQFAPSTIPVIFVDNMNCLQRIVDVLRCEALVCLNSTWRCGCLS